MPPIDVVVPVAAMASLPAITNDNPNGTPNESQDAVPASGLSNETSSHFSIVDIRSQHAETDLREEIISMLNPVEGPRALPTLLLYDEKGLQLFEDITYLDEYYLTNAEIDLLARAAENFVGKIPEGSMLVELGSGNLRKVCLLLQAFEKAQKSIDYYALDLSLKELERTLAQVPPFQYVSCHGLHGTYDDGKEWLKKHDGANRHKFILHLGSSIGNFSRQGAVDFLRGFVEVLQPADGIIIAVDGCHDPSMIFHAYNDRHGVTHQFIINGLQHANRILKDEIFNIEDWQVIGEYVYDDSGGRHRAFLSPVKDVNVLGTYIRSRERIQIEQSCKYSKLQLDRLWQQAGLRQVDCCGNSSNYALYLLKPVNSSVKMKKLAYAESPVPSLDEWQDIWKAWDVVTRQMMPEEMLHQKPILLRNACIFYLGHIPTFLDLQLTKTNILPPTEPASYSNIFERGIDPDVNNPEHCHAHSETPTSWPPLSEILEYQTRVRARVQQLYANGAANVSRKVGRAIWLGFEHELMHLETLLYMMLQSNQTLPPPDIARPNFQQLAEEAKRNRVPNQWFDIPAQSVTIGMDDLEDNEDPACYFGWDNEKPQRKCEVHAFQAQGRAITNEEYLDYMRACNVEPVPASWAVGDVHNHAEELNNLENEPISWARFLDGKCVKTVFGLVPLKYALDWPVCASYDELAGCAAWMGGRIPTFEECRSIYAWVNHQGKIEANTKLSNRVPAVNAHLVNNGVQETPPPESDVRSAKVSSQLFSDLVDANIGFQNWHVLPVTQAGGKLAGQAGIGGLWELTSSKLQQHEGFEPMTLYPSYTADFFDNKHHIVLGGSWATHPRIAGRKSFVNWYQHNYPYMWTGARLVRDV